VTTATSAGALPLLIGGPPAGSAESPLEVINPFTGELLDRVAQAGPAEAERAIEAARRARVRAQTRAPAL
jgi:acyl-CoA reductase-like NAD-dependent aldehyde dehydrogenase